MNNFDYNIIICFNKIITRLQFNIFYILLIIILKFIEKLNY